MTSKQQKIDELNNLGQKSGFIVMSEYQNMLSRLTLKCTTCQNVWSAYAREILDGLSPCQKCEARAKDPAVPLEKVFTDYLQLEYERNFIPEGTDLAFSFFIEYNNTAICTQVVDVSISTDVNAQEELEKRIKYCDSHGILLFVVDSASAKSENIVHDLFELPFISIGKSPKSSGVFFSNEDIFRYRKPIQEVEFSDDDSDDTDDDKDMTERIAQLTAPNWIVLDEHSFISHEFPCIEGKVAYLGYIRLGENQITLDSLQSQQLRIQQFVKLMDGYIKRFYYEIGVSGKEEYTSRLSLIRLIEDCKPGEKLIVTKFDRLSRNVQDTLSIYKKLNTKHVGIITIDLNFDSSSQTGKLVFQLLGIISDVKEKPQELKQAYKRKIRVKPGYGYKFVSRTQPYEKVPSEQTTIEYIRTLKKSHPEYTLGQICYILNQERAVHVPRKAKQWYPAVIKGICLREHIDIYANEI